MEDYGLRAKKLNLLLCNDAVKDKPLSILDLILSNLQHKVFIPEFYLISTGFLIFLPMS